MLPDQHRRPRGGLLHIISKPGDLLDAAELPNQALLATVAHKVPRLGLLREVLTAC